MAKIGVFDLCSFFWTVAGTRKRGEDPYGLALQVLRYVRSCAEKVGVEDVIFGADGPSGRSFRRSVCPDYKAGREAKDPEMVAELAALEAALTEAGFTVHKAEASSGSSAAGGEPEWFEGDDVVASFAVTILRDPDSEVLVGSNDWDLAPLLAFPKVRLFTTKGEERTAADVKKDFGVEPLMLPQLKALAGDSDGYKPFPGLEKGKPGIGDKTAAAILEKFGSAEAAVRAALAVETHAPAFDGLPSRTAALLKAGGEAALVMGLTCAKLRTDAPVPGEIGFGEWAEVEAALLGRQKAQQSEPRPEVITPPAGAAKAFRKAAHTQLAETTIPEAIQQLDEKALQRIGELASAVPDLIGRARDPNGAGMVAWSRPPVCPRCLGVEPGKPAGDPDHPHPGPFTAEVCAPCEAVLSKPIAVTQLSVGRLPESFIADLVAAEGEKPLKDPDEVEEVERLEWLAENGSSSEQVNARAELMKRGFRNPPGSPPAPRRRRSKAAVTPPIPDLEAASKVNMGTLTREEIQGMGHPVGWTPQPPEPTVFVLLTGAEFIALTPLPALAAAGLLTPPEAYAGKFAALLDALREGAFRPCDGVFIGSVPEACAQAVMVLSGCASGGPGWTNPPWSSFVEQLSVLPRFADLAKYGGKLVRA